jgi:hypothetical protein
MPHLVSGQSIDRAVPRLLAAFLLTAMMSAAAFAAPSLKTLSFATHFVPDTPAGAVGYDGTLNLRIDAEGIVEGTYRPNGSGPFVPVVGGLEHNQIWLDFGDRGWRIYGVLRKGSIVAGTFRDGKLWDFTAIPLGRRG